MQTETNVFKTDIFEILNMYSTIIIFHKKKSTPGNFEEFVNKYTDFFNDLKTSIF